MSAGRIADNLVLPTSPPVNHSSTSPPICTPRSSPSQDPPISRPTEHCQVSPHSPPVLDHPESQVLQRTPTYPDPQSPTSAAQRSSTPTPRSSTPIPRSSTPIPISPIPALRSPSTPSPAAVQTSNPSQCDVSGILNH